MLLLVVTGFHSGRELLPHPVLLVVGFARMLAMYIIAMYIIPMITMRLFPVEAQDRTVESQVTLASDRS